MRNAMPPPLTEKITSWGTEKVGIILLRRRAREGCSPLSEKYRFIGGAYSGVLWTKRERLALRVRKKEGGRETLPPF